MSSHTSYQHDRPVGEGTPIETVHDAIDKRRGKSGSKGAFAGEPVVSSKQVILRPPPSAALPLDDFWPGIHLATYFFAGFGGTVLEVRGKDTQSV